MKNRILNIIHLPGLYLRLYRAAKIQKNYIKLTLENDIQEIEKENDGSLSDFDFKKIRAYYGFAVPAILGEGFSMLTGRPISEHERKILTYGGALTGLFDDFFDEKEIPDERILYLIDKPNEADARNTHEKLFIRLFTKSMQFIDDAQNVKAAIAKVYDAQIESRKQRDSNISQEAIQHITIEKGGVSILLYRSLFNEPLSNVEQELYYYLGGIGQLENDIFDIYKDYQGGIATLATTTKSIAPLRKTYTTLLEKVFYTLDQTHFPSNNKKIFARFIGLVMSRGLVCLDFLEHSETKSNHTFEVSQYSRQQLVCDMERFKNRWKLIRYYSSYLPTSNEHNIVK